MKKPNEKLRYERERRGWSQRKVADAIGTSEGMVSRWEGGECKPRAFFQEKLCEIFKKSAEELGFMEEQHIGQLPAHSYQALARYLQYKRMLLLDAFAPGATHLRMGEIVGRDGLFIPPSWTLLQNTTPPTDLVGYLIEALSQNQRLLLLGEAGQGKTTVLKQVFTLMADRFLDKPHSATPFPLYIPLREFASFSGNAIELLWSHLCDELPLLLTDFGALIRNHRIVFLFDGFDEMSGDLTQRAINERAASKIFALPSILSCRKNFYEFYLSMSPLQELYPQQIELRPLTLTHPVTQYITAFYQKKRENTSKESIILPERIITTIQQNQALRGLVQHPLSLVMMLDIATDLQDIERNSWSKANLYQKYTEKWLKHEAAKPDSVLRWHEKSMLIQEIAWWLYIAKGPVTSAKTPHEQVTFTQQELSRLLKDLTSSHSISLAQLLDDICLRTFLLANDGDTYYFIHKSFQEYYVARYILERLQGREQTIDVITQVLQEFLPVEIFGFLKAMLHAHGSSERERDLVTENLMRAYQHNNRQDHRSATIRQNASHYLAFLGTQKAIQFLEQAYEGEPDKWVRRGIMVGLALFCGRGDILERYIESLHTDPEAASINIGYHLVYYGDQSPEERYYDRGGEQCEKTVQAIFHHLENAAYRHEWALDLLTLRMLLEGRGLAIFSSNTRYWPFLKGFLSKNDQGQGDVFQREKQRLQEALERIEHL